MLIILTGKSGSGKDAILKALCKRVHCERFVTLTTRPMRAGEIDGLDYYFITNERFEAYLRAKKFIEYYQYKTVSDGEPTVYYYGSPKKTLEPEKTYVIILDPQGVAAFIDYYGKDACKVISIETSDEIRHSRASSRGSMTTEEWENRLKADERKFSDDFIEAYVDYRIDNSGILDDAVCHICDILT